MPRLLKCPHCATPVEYGVSVRSGCWAQVTYWTSEGKLRVALTAWAAVPAIVCFAAVFGTAVLLIPTSTSETVGNVVGVLGFTVGLAGGVAGYRVGCRLSEGIEPINTVTFSRRYPDGIEKVVQLEVR
jgi:hypothetical protein